MSKKRSTGHSRIYRRIIWTCTWYVRCTLDGSLLIEETQDSLARIILDILIGDTWAALEKLVKAGKIRSIGVSNFTIEKMQELLVTAEIPPAVNQIEAHPYLLQPKVLQYLKENNILPVAYSPLGNNIFGAPRVVDNPVVIEISKTLGKDPAGLLISWAVQRGSAVIPKSVTPARIESNFQDFIIPEAEFEALKKLDRHQRYSYPFRWGVDVFGELGAEDAERRAEEHVVKLRESENS
ncbi:uncharacterized protein CDV56_108403 [Aspergillus thermomutatus]|uniref:D-xylose reductase [NAD(P)H] n=1 Tax=Aspergillus thermomutatus TaxID=41047 RepID=A0A397HNP3_ASPTH|nr:uncharacterized protein CDV56_108403 [Aspergillus thermomutatus]RHZ62803.1 hypothetical protein CDV56_108403 [Aspergillus thermomutatus]